jgi:hypothetical protein
MGLALRLPLGSLVVDTAQVVDIGPTVRCRPHMVVIHTEEPVEVRMVPERGYHGNPAATVGPTTAKIVFLILIHVVINKQDNGISISRHDREQSVENIIEVELATGNFVG